MPNEINPRVFVVDDERIITETLQAILNRSGFSTKAFVDRYRQTLDKTSPA